MAVLTKEQLATLGLFFIVAFASFLNHTVLPIPPTLAFFFLGSLCFLGISITTSKIYDPLVMRIPLLAAGYYLFSQLLIGGPPTHFAGVVFAILYFVAVASYGRFVPEEVRTSLVKFFIFSSVIIFILECIWRFTHPDPFFKTFADMGDPRWIYQYKFGGFMYADSNAVAIHLIVVLFFAFYRQKYFKERYPLSILLLLVLLVLTISRAAWLGAFIGLLYYQFLYKKGAIAYAMGIVLVTFALLVGLVLAMRAVQSDLSFISKLDILNLIINYFSNIDLPTLFFGVGFSNSSNALGVYAHNLIMVFLIESGICGLVVLLALIMFLNRVTEGRAMVVILPFLVTTLSATITFIPFFFMVMGLMYLDVTSKLKSDRAY